MIPVPSPMEMRISITATKSLMELKVTFFKSFFPAKAPAIAAKVADTSKITFSDKPEDLNREA
jgi:hypothetical protein